MGYNYAISIMYSRANYQMRESLYHLVVYFLNTRDMHLGILADSIILQ